MSEILLTEEGPIALQDDQLPQAKKLSGMSQKLVASISGQ